MKVLLLIVCLSGALIAYPQLNSPIFEKYIDIFEGETMYACNYPLCLTSVNEVEFDIEPIAYHIKDRMVVVGIAVFMPTDVVWTKKKPTLIINLKNSKEVDLPLLLFDREDGICYFKFTPETKSQLESVPINRIILKNNKQKCTSKELNSVASSYLIELIDQEIHQIFTPIYWSYPYYYND